MMDKTVKRGTRTGFTTGACSAAAARAAVLGLVHGAVPETVESLLPNGDVVHFAVHDGRCDADTAHAMVIKDAGDDPDCTDKAHLTAEVRVLHDRAGVVVLLGGFGVGTVTINTWHCLSTSRSAVYVAWAAATNSSADTSSVLSLPAWSSAMRAALISNPITLRLLANSTAKGRPT